jgi:hypothetical protein
MTEHDGGLTEAELFFRANNIRFAKSVELLPEGDWARVTEGISHEDFTRVGDEGTSTPLAFYCSEFGTAFAVVPTSMEVDPRLTVPVFDVYINEKELFPEPAEDTVNVIYLETYIDRAHNEKIMEWLEDIFGGIPNGRVMADTYDIPANWEVLRKHVNIGGALAEIAMISSNRLWRVVPLREPDSDRMVDEQVMLLVGPPAPIIEEGLTVDESTNPSFGRDLRLITGGGGTEDIDK